MFSYDGSKRPTVEELRDHPWMKKSMDIKQTRSDLLEKLSSIRSERTADSSAAAGSSRAIDNPLYLAREMHSGVQLNKMFDDNCDFDTTAQPGEIEEKFNEYIAENERLSLETNEEKKWMKISLKDEEVPENNF